MARVVVAAGRAKLRAFTETAAVWEQRIKAGKKAVTENARRSERPMAELRKLFDIPTSIEPNGQCRPLTRAEQGVGMSTSIGLNGQCRPLTPAERERLCDACDKPFCGPAVQLVELRCPQRHCYHRECFARLLVDGKLVCPKCRGVQTCLFINLTK
jgi:hypothetical protein